MLYSDLKLNLQNFKNQTKDSYSYTKHSSYKKNKLRTTSYSRSKSKIEQVKFSLNIILKTK